MFQLLATIGIVLAIVLITRLFGAWMLRIDEVINQLKKANKNLEELKKE